jgi:uncharacterized protein YceH (UPF0502 family)
MVSLRLSEVEHQRLIELASIKGAHSTSDLARAAICDYLQRQDNHSDHEDSAAVDLQKKVEELEREVRRLSRLASAATPGWGVGK